MSKMGSDSMREQWVIEQLKALPGGLRILDAGAGQCKYKKHCSHLCYVAQDFDGYDGSGNNKGLQTKSWDLSNIDIVCDITKIPEKDNSFDAILCIEVIEHLPDPISALKELTRLLKKDGKLILTAPFASLTHYAPFHFYSGFNKYFYDKFLGQLGYFDISVEPHGNFFDYMVQEVGRLPSVAHSYCASAFSTDELAIFSKAIDSLRKMSEKDSGSSDLLCYGYRVLAKKG